MRKYLDIKYNAVFGLILAFLLNACGPFPAAQAQALRLPAPGVMVALSPAFDPPILKGIRVHPNDPFRLDFILDRGDGQPDDAQVLRVESTKLVKYFLASLTIPEKDLWVNLSPYEKDRIIPQSFGQTEMGRDLLAEDYMLKQITASLIYPEGEIGKRFWKRVYEEAGKRFGTTNVPVNTFNKVWIVPEKAEVYENVKAGTAYVVESRLKVMLEQDYLSLEKNQLQPGDWFRRTCPQADCLAIKALNMKASQVNPRKRNDNTSELGSQVIREIVIPELTREVNEGKNFALLRQVYNSLILAAWYKKKMRDSILAQVYEDKNKIQGITPLPNAMIRDPQHIYQQYLKAFRKGAYNFIKEETDLSTGQVFPRKYFSGGVDETDLSMKVLKTTSGIDAAQLSKKALAVVGVRLNSFNDGIPVNWVTFQDYMRDVQSANESGEFVYASAQHFDPKADEFGHYRNDGKAGFVWAHNSRGFSTDGQVLLAGLLGRSKKRTVTALEVGPGTGYGLWSMKQMSPRLVADTISLTPLAPHVVLKKGIGELFRQIVERIQNGTYRDIPDFDRFVSMWTGKQLSSLNKNEKIEVLGLVEQLGAYSGMPFDLLFEFQKNGYDVFEKLSKPYIRRQYIGEFMDKDIKIDTKYDFIYDNRGGIYYSGYDSKNSQENPLKKAGDLLSPEGVLFLEEWPNDIRFLVNHELAEEFAVISLSKGNKMIILHKHGSLFNKVKGLLIPTNGGLSYELWGDDIKGFVNHMTAREEKASTVAAPVTMPGGIDLSQTVDKIKMSTDGNRGDFNMDSSRLGMLQDSSGFEPVIISILPIGNLSTFLDATTA